MVFAAVLQIRYGYRFAKGVLLRHEYHQCGAGASLHERMDCHNNSYGLIMGARYMHLNHLSDDALIEALREIVGRYAARGVCRGTKPGSRTMWWTVC